MIDPTNRTFVCSVLFLDIVEYSKRSVAEQMRQKQKFNALLEQALKGVALNDRIVLDTGDGAAVSFLGNPEDALYVGMSLRHAISAEPPSSPERLSVRTGVNLGAVRLIRDLNGQMNIIGDAINVAQRVMGFAQPGQILVSRSYYEVVYRLDPQFEKLFKYEGARADKHVREHEIYAVGAGTGPIPALVDGAVGSPFSARVKAGFSWPLRVNARLGIALPLAMAIIIAAGIIVRVQRAAPPAAELDASPASSSTRSSKPRLAERSRSAWRAEALAEGLQETPPEQALARRAFAENRQSSRRPAEREKAAALQQGNAAAQLLIVPWGEVIVDGQRRGVSPPLRVIELSPGSHKLEIRNGAFPVHTEQLSLRAGEQLTIRHRFD